MSTHTIFNEQTKLLATAINNVAFALVVVGFVTPVTAVSFGFTSAPILGTESAIFMLVWLVAGLALHWSARQILLDLKP